jgi:peptidoglycan hydrolase-like protein with peptidoglycan-binding domain
MVANQRRLALIVIGAVVVAGIGGVLAGRAIKSPDQIAAETKAPNASLITVPVEKRGLSADLVVRGTARHSAPAAVTLATSLLKPPGGTFTSLPAPGAEIADGAVALVAAGRPVFTFAGALPSYRDITVGVSGPDVRQLQEALVRLGINPGRTDGVYDARSAAAVATFYDRSGWAPFGLTDSQRKDLQFARDAALSAEDRRLQALLAVEQARGTSRSSTRAAAAALADARSRLSAARTVQSNASALLRIASANERRDNAAARAEVIAKSTLRDAAAADLRAAQTDRNNPPPNATQAELDALQQAVDDAQIVLDQANADLDAARANQDAVRISGAANVDQATNDLSQATSDVAAAVEEVARAQASYDDAVAADTSAGGSSTEVSILNAIAAVAARQAAAAQADYSELASKSGVQVPADELLFFPSMPLRVDEVNAKPGELIKDSFMTLSGLQLVIDSSVTPQDAKLVTKGAKVVIEETDLKVNTTGTVTFLADRPGTNGVDSSRFYLEVTPIDAPPQLIGASVKLSISVKSTSGEVLAVPSSALTIGADGSTRVQVLRPDNRTDYVDVNAGLAAQGLVEVTVRSGNLQAGDLVVVGFEGAGKGVASGGRSTNAPTQNASVGG